MINFARHLLMACLILGLAGCGRNPHEVVVPQNGERFTESDQKAIAKLSSDDQRLLMAYQLRHGLNAMGDPSKGVPPGETVGRAIDEQKGIEVAEAKKAKEAEALKQEVLKEHDEAVARLNGVLRVALLDLHHEAPDFRAGQYDDEISQKIAFENLSEKDIAGLKGVVVFKDQFGDVIMRVGITLDDDIKARQKFVWEGGFHYNQFKDSHQRLVTTSADKIKFDFEPRLILFKDGTKIEASDASASE